MMHQDLIADEGTRIFQRMDGPVGEFIDEHGVRHRCKLKL
jgi:hypothetical protein